jgi:hypothetical protein
LPDSTERWLPVPGFEGYYEVSDSPIGLIRSLDRVVPHPGGDLHIKGRLLRPGRNRNYRLFNLSKGGVHTGKYAHQAVLEAFVGPCPPGMQALHGPAGDSDNSPGNLRWGTCAENMADKNRDGTNYHANKTHCDSGHEFTPANVRRKNGGRECRKCEAVRRYAKYHLLHPDAETGARRGEKNPQSKLTEVEARGILAMLAGGHARSEIAQFYNTTVSNVSHIACGESWAWLTEDRAA